ncbi:S8 family serine peptidase [Mariniblastus sp.]|nr:S8 family serine peptidase [Mariniblastus sp.]
MSPASCTSHVWNDRSWPIKPDIVMEGGNNAIDPDTNQADNVDDLSLLTTRVDLTGPILTTTGDTSGAAALAARYAAIINARYPALWPESVRGMLVHSARWTGKMLEQVPGKKVRDYENRLRCFGYGVPNLDRALTSIESSATLIIQGSMQPFHQVEALKDDGKPSKRIATKDMHVHTLPWPVRVLQDLGEVEVRMRVTLSFFIEPSPGRRGWTRKHRYQSHGLLFEVKRPTETTSDLLKRVSDAARDENEDISFGSDTRNWLFGDRLRRKGSIHSDVWTGTAAELAASEAIAIYPVTGWWKERHHLGRWNRQARYSLIVTLETDAEDVDLYTPIANEIAIET